MTENWHVTWTGGGESDGLSTLAPGYYPADDDHSASCTVAPAEYVLAYCRRVDPLRQYPGTAADAVRAWAREQGLPCG